MRDTWQALGMLSPGCVVVCVVVCGKACHAGRKGKGVANRCGR